MKKIWPRALEGRKDRVMAPRCLKYGYLDVQCRACGRVPNYRIYRPYDKVTNKLNASQLASNWVACGPGTRWWHGNEQIIPSHDCCFGKKHSFFNDYDNMRAAVGKTFIEENEHYVKSFEATPKPLPSLPTQPKPTPRKFSGKCKNGCDIPDNWANDGYCDCPECEDEITTGWTCDNCRCPNHCNGIIKRFTPSLKCDWKPPKNIPGNRRCLMCRD